MNNNNTNICYPYLSAYLQSIIRTLPFDYKYNKLDMEGRVEYVDKLLKEADEATAKYVTRSGV
jgi:hypothetical protein